MTQFPDTLDLTRHAELAAGFLSANLDPERDYEAAGKWVGQYFLAAKFLEAIPMMRLMSGSQVNTDVEQNAWELFLENLGEDGLWYCPNRFPERHSGRGYKHTDEDYTTPYANARLIFSLMYRHQLDGSDHWLEAAKRVAGGLSKIAIRKDNYAYYPDAEYAFDYAYLQKSGFTSHAEPQGENEGAEGTLKFYQANQIRALARLAELTGDEQALETATLIKNFIMLPKFWEPEMIPKTVGAEHGQWAGHFHGHMTSFRALLEYAQVTGDQQLKEFVRYGYDFSRQFGIAAIGWSPCFVGKGRMIGHKHACETCSISGFIAVAVKLSEYGLGDYWDDVDGYVRNHLVESQFVDREYTNCFLGKSEDDLRQSAGVDWAAGDYYGGFQGASELTALTNGACACCSGNGSSALYYAWEAAVKELEGQTEVNLLWNRSTKSVDIKSWIPNRGEVQFHIKKPIRLSVRIPSWVDRKLLNFATSGEQPSPQPFIVANRMVFPDLKPGQVVTLTFPIVETIRTYSLPELPYAKGHTDPIVPHTTFSCTFRGSVMVDVSPRIYNPWFPEHKYPIYERDHMRTDDPGMVEKQFNVPDKLIHWH